MDPILSGGLPPSHSRLRCTLTRSAAQLPLLCSPPALLSPYPHFLPWLTGLVLLEHILQEVLKAGCKGGQFV